MKMIAYLLINVVMEFSIFLYFSPCKRPSPALTLPLQYFVPSLVIIGPVILDKKQLNIILTDNDQSLY